MRVLMIGDVVGDPGLEILEERLGGLIEQWEADFTIVNGENAAGGFGLSEETLDRILASGADAVTGGNHIWEKRDFWPVLDSGKRGADGETFPRVIRPANYPGAVGKGWSRLKKNGLEALLVNLQGRELMRSIDCPFRCLDRIIGEYAGSLPVLVDFHAESASEKEALARHVDGRVSALAGTHTHVQTADEMILKNGTAYISDLGMTGVQNGIIGMDSGICRDRAKSGVAYRMECAKAEEDLSNCGIRGIAVTIDADTGHALSIERIKVDGRFQNG